MYSEGLSFPNVEIIILKIKLERDILIIEDSVAAIELLDHFLKKLGYQNSYSCTGGITGIAKFKELVKSDQLPLVFLDYYLPDIDSISVFDQILETQPETKVIIETIAEKDEEGIRYLTQHGAYHYLQKPISFRRLKEVMNTYEKERVCFMKNLEHDSICTH